MGAVRAALRALLLAVLSVLCGGLAALAAPLRLLGAAGDRLALRVALLAQQLWCRGILAIVAVRVREHGAPPGAACVVVSNHLSYLDVALLGSRRRLRFVAKADVARWPFIGQLATLARVIFLRREAARDLLRVGDEIRKSLAAGVPVVFFPEGTSTRGLDVQPFHAGLLQPAAELRLPCLPVTVRYETPADSPPASESVCWWGEMTFPPHLWSLMKLPRVDAEVRWGETPVIAPDRKELAAALHARVAAAFVPVRQAAEPAPR